MNVTSQNTSNDKTLIHQFTYDGDEMDSIVVTVSEAVADVTETPMEEIPPLQETLDCDSLESLINSFDLSDVSGIGYVQFPFHECTIRIDTTGTIQVYDSNRRISTDSSRC